MTTRHRNYPLLLVSQFLSAFGDNAILAVIVGQLTLLQKVGMISPEQLRQQSTLYTSLLFVPYVLLAPLAGYLNDRYAKTSWLSGGNAFKLLGTAICALSIWFGYVWQAPGYLIVGIGSCVYGPAKYGILPEILPRERLVKANGMVELLTLVAILAGYIVGSALVDHVRVSVCYGVLMGIYGSSWVLNLAMTKTPANPAVQLRASAVEFGQHFLSLMGHARLGRVLVGTALFWVCGAAMKINFQAWGLEVLHLPNNTQIALLGLWLSVGVMTGSILAGQWHAVGDLGRTRIYGLGLAGLLLLLYSVEPLAFWRQGTVTLAGLRLVLPVVVLLILCGVAAGLFLIPLNATLQAESDPQRLGKTIAVQNVYDNVGMLLASGLIFLCVQFKITSGQVFAVLAGIVVLVVLALRIPAPSAGVKPSTEAIGG